MLLDRPRHSESEQDSSCQVTESETVLVPVPVPDLFVADPNSFVNCSNSPKNNNNNNNKMAAHLPVLKSRGQGRGGETPPGLSAPDKPIHAAKRDRPRLLFFFLLYSFFLSFLFLLSFTFFFSPNSFFVLCEKCVSYTSKNGKVNPFELAARPAHGMNKQACREKAIQSH